MKRTLLHILPVLACILAFSPRAAAQFKGDAFSQNYADPNAPEEPSDSTEVLFSFKEYFQGLGHKQQVEIGTVFAGSTIFIGGEQIYNRQYWKLPIIYGSLAATTGLGFWYNGKYKSSVKAFDEAYALNPETTLAVDSKSKHMRNIMFGAAGAVYWATLMDGVFNYDRKTHPQAGKATLYSVLCPGLGQAYNGEYWKIPIYWGCLIGSYHYLKLNDTNYKRYKRIHNEATNPDITYTGPIPAETALYYRNVFRRYRDYSIVALVGFYMLQAIDANVFAYMGDFEVTDDITLNVSPTVISPEVPNAYAFRPAVGGNAYGLSIGFNF